MSKKPIKVDYSPSDFLGGTILLDVYEELAYRRICDLIYVMDGKLPDDKALADLTKMRCHFELPLRPRIEKEARPNREGKKRRRYH